MRVLTSSRGRRGEPAHGGFTDAYAFLSSPRAVETLTSRIGRRDGGSFAPVGELPTRHTNETAALQEYLRIDPFAS